jgi:hypothetical protein
MVGLLNPKKNFVDMIADSQDFTLSIGGINLISNGISDFGCTP